MLPVTAATWVMCQRMPAPARYGIVWRRVRQRLATCGNGWQPAGNSMAGRVWKPVPRCNVGQRWKMLATLENAGNAGKSSQRWKSLATLEIAGNAGNCWQRWKLLATLEKNRVTPFPHFQQFLHVRRSNGFWHLAAPLAHGRPTGQHLHLLGTTPFATMRGLDMLLRPQGGRWCSRPAKAWRAHLMACHFFRRRMPLPDGEFLRKVPRQMDLVQCRVARRSPSRKRKRRADLDRRLRFRLGPLTSTSRYLNHAAK